MVSFSSVVLVSAAATVAVAQFVKTPTGFTETKGYLDIPVRYKEVPTGICELDPKVKSYSGYVDVAENQHMFFWFFEAKDVDPTTAPLTVWINGGPGSSSMIGLFQENGPCGVDSNGKVVSNPYAWNTISNLIFIDQPTQTGFSYSIPINGYVDPNTGDIVPLPNATCPDFAVEYGTCGTYSLPDLTLTANSTQDAAPNFYRTLQGFMGAFPQYARKGFHFASESYGGHYGPVFNEYIKKQNKAHDVPGAFHIKLQTVLIGNGWFDPLLQYISYYNFTVFPGNTYDYSPYNASIQALLYDNLWGAGNCVDQIKNCYATGLDDICSTADNYCFEQVEYIYDIVLNRDEYDMRELMPDRFPYSYYIDYLNRPDVQEAIGAYQNYSESSGAVGTAFGATGDDGRESGTLEAIKYLLDEDITVMLYAGDADYVCNWLGVEAVAHQLGIEGFEKAGYVDLVTSDNIVHGQVKQYGKFSFVRIYESGHEVPFYQPLASLAIFERAIKTKDIATGRHRAADQYTTLGTKESTYREGNGTMQFEVLPPDATYNTTTNEPNATKRAEMVKRRAPGMVRSWKSGIPRK